MVVIGLDGVPYSYIQRLFAASALPNFRAQAGEGALAQMDTSASKQEVYVNTRLHDAGYLRSKGAQPRSLEDITATRLAYRLDPGRIFLNVRGREPDSRVVPGAEYERLRRELAEALASMRDPATGEAMVERVYLREELYHGPYAAAAPDLMLALHDGYDPKGTFGKDHLTYSGAGAGGDAYHARCAGVHPGAAQVCAALAYHRCRSDASAPARSSGSCSYGWAHAAAWLSTCSSSSERVQHTMDGKL